MNEVLEKEEAVQETPKTRRCKCGNDAKFIKDFWITESKTKKVELTDDAFTEKVECVCGILRRRFCPSCLSKIAAQQKRFNRRLNNIILISIFIPLAMAVGKFAYDRFVSRDASALLPFIASIAFTVVFEGFLAYKLLSAQAKRSKIEHGNYDDLRSIDALIDSLNYGLEDYKKVKDVPSIDIVSDGEGRVNYDMERSGFNMRVTLNGRINIEPMTERMKYPFKDEAEYVKRTYVNADLFGDNMKAIDEKELSEKDFDVRNGTLMRYSGLAVNLVLPENVTSIGFQAFKNSKNCEKVVIPESVNNIEKEAFSGCPASEINIPPYIKDIKAFTFYRSGIKEAIIPEGVEVIEDSAFCECFALEKVVIPGSCKKVGPNAFKGCLQLKELVIGEGVEALSDYSFNGCTALTELVVPEGVYEVGNFAFENCTSLADLWLPDSIQFMGGRAFEGNIKLVVHGKEGSYAEQFAALERKQFALTDQKKRFDTTVERKAKKG